MSIRLINHTIASDKEERVFGRKLVNRVQWSYIHFLFGLKYNGLMYGKGAAEEAFRRGKANKRAG